MNSDDGLAPRVMALGPMEDNMAAANGSHCKVLAPELGHGCELLPKRPVLVFNVLGKHWRVVTNLYASM